MGAQLQQVSPRNFFLAFLLLSLGRVLIVIIAKDVLDVIGYPISFSRIFYIVSTSDMAKYLPGGIWHFVGRAGYYHAVDMPVAMITKAMIQEHLWFIVSAGLASSLFLTVGYGSVWGLLIIPIWVLIIYLWGRHVALSRIVMVVVVQFVMWLVTGFSFAILLPGMLSAPQLMIATGAFTLSWLIGFLMIFAPGGIGVREVVLVAVLSPILLTTDSTVFAIIHRILWVIVEFLFALVAWLFFNLDRH